VSVLYWRSHRPAKLTDKDTIVIADFTNTTGDTVFDDSLRQALTIGLRQSPFLNILSDEELQETLRLMGRQGNEQLTRQVAREICQRTSSAAVIAGSISSLGGSYVVDLNASNCRSGDILAQEQVQAQKKEDVLKALGDAVTSLRPKLGESLATVQRFDAPLPLATTSSLQALQAYANARRVFHQSGASPALPYYHRAIELDPNFALAYAYLGDSFETSLQEPGLAAECLQKAYELRDRVTESERFSITSDYYALVTGELDKSLAANGAWANAFPREPIPHLNNGYVSAYLGKYDVEVQEMITFIRLAPTDAAGYANLMEGYIALGKIDEAKVVGRQALDKNMEGQFLHDDLYLIAFLEGDTDEMQRQVQATAGKASIEDILLSVESDTHAYYGRLAKARGFSRRASQLAKLSEQPETAALWLLNSALREAEFGNLERARQDLKDGLALAATRDVQTLAALALACSGELVRARAMADSLQKEHPLNIMLNRYWLPTIRAYIEIHSGRHAQAVSLLQDAAVYDLAFPLPQYSEGGTLYPSYVRGQAYLGLRQGKEAAAEFQKFIDHRTIVANYPLVSLARLGLARAYKLQNDASKARAGYQDFLALWKNADPDIPILKQAKAEYAKLQ